MFGRDMNRPRRERWFHGYKSTQKILLVGEGDFSFSACLARALRTAENMVATSYLDEDWLVEKHWTSVPHLDQLKRQGCLLLYEVDVYNMDTHPTLKKMKFDVIIFNFPHAGHYDYLCERDLELIEMHKELVGAYFKSASKMLNDGGEVHLRHREDPPYDSWNVVGHAGKAGLKLKDKEQFLKSDYPGYHNKRGGVIKTNKTFPILCAYTYKFALDLPKVDDHHPKKDEFSDRHDDLCKKDKVHVLEMREQGHNDRVHVLVMNDQVQDNEVRVSETKDQHCLKTDEVNDSIQKNEVKDDLSIHKNNDEVVNVPKKHEVWDDVGEHVPEEHAKNDGGDADLLKNEVVNDLEVNVLKKKPDIGDSDTMNDDDPNSCQIDDEYRVNVDLDLPKIGDDHMKNVEVYHDYGLPKEDKVNELDMKDQDHDKQHTKSDENSVDNHDLPRTGEINIIYEKHPNNDKVHGDDHDPPKINEIHLLMVKDNDHAQHYSKTDKFHDRSPKSDEVDNDLLINEMNNNPPKNDEVDVDLTKMNNTDDELEKKDDVCEQDIYEEVDDELAIQILEMKDLVEKRHIKNETVEEEEVFNDLSLHMLEMRHHVHTKNENDLHGLNEVYIMEAIKDDDHDIDVAEMKDYVHDQLVENDGTHDHHNDAKKDRLNGYFLYLNKDEAAERGDLLEIKAQVHDEDRNVMNKMKHSDI